jgi:hypothetical protein
MLNLDKVKDVLAIALNAYALQPAVEIVEQRHGHVFILAFNQDPAFPDVGAHMIKLERWMKKFLEVKDLELLCEDIDDINKRNTRSGRPSLKMVNARNVDKLED